MTAIRTLTPLRAGGYGLPVPPRAGSWRIDAPLSSLQLCIREFHRTSRIEAPVLGGEITMTESAGTSAIELRFGPPSTAHASSAATGWTRALGLDDPDQPLRYVSSHVLASPFGWRMCGRLRAEHFDALLVADARIYGVYTRLDGHDAMDVTAIGAIQRPRTRALGDSLLRPRIVLRMRTHFVHD